MTRETFDMAKVGNIKGALQNAPPVQGKLSKAQVLRELAPDLKVLRERKGYTLEQIVELLGTQGLKITVSTLQSAFKKKGGNKRKTGYETLVERALAKPVPADASNTLNVGRSAPEQKANGAALPARSSKPVKVA
jgi:hypothetical protein